MVSDSSDGTSASNPPFIARLKNCEGCQKRKEFLMSGNFLVGVVVGIGVVWVWHKVR